MPFGTAPVISVSLRDGHHAFSDLRLGLSHVPGGVGTEDTGWPVGLWPSGSCLRGGWRDGASPPIEGDDQEGDSEFDTASLTCSSEAIAKMSD